MAVINGYKELIVFEKAYKLSMEIFECSKEFPREEKYSLTDQIRRASRSICANISEAWAKKIYEKHFISKLSDSLGEEYETEVWLQYCLDCKYITPAAHQHLTKEYDEVRKLLLFMMNNSGRFCRKSCE